MSTVSPAPKRRRFAAATATAVALFSMVTVAWPGVAHATSGGSGGTPDVQIVKTATQGGEPLAEGATLKPGDAFDYVLTVTNEGTGKARSVVVTDELPAGVDTTGTNPVVTDLGTLISGQTEVVTIPVRVSADAKACATFTNTASVTYVHGYGEEFSADSNAFPLAVECSSAKSIDLSLAKLVNGKPTASVTVGDTVTYTLTVSNAGPDDATGVVVEDTMPAGVAFVAQTGGDGTLSADGATWTVGDVPADGSASVTFTATVDDVGSHTNVAEITKADQPDTDSTPGNGCTGAGADEDDCAEATVIAAAAVGGLTLVKSNDPTDVVKFGDTITYTLTVTAETAQTGVWVTDTIPGYDAGQPTSGTTTYVPGSATCVVPPTGATCDVTTTTTGGAVTGLTWGLGDMAAGTTRQVTFAVTADKQDAVVAGSETVDFVNVGAVSSDQQPAVESNTVLNTAVLTKVSDNTVDGGDGDLPATGPGMPVGQLALVGLLLVGIGIALVRQSLLVPATYRGRHVAR